MAKWHAYHFMLLQLYVEERNQFLHHIVAREKTWVLHYILTNKHSSVDWKHISLPISKKFFVTPSAGKVLTLVL